MRGLREVAFFFLICFHSWPVEKPERESHDAPNVASEFRVKVKVYDGVNLSSRENSSAEQEAAKIFRYAGIQLRWPAGLRSAALNNNTPSERWKPASFKLKIWPSATVGGLDSTVAGTSSRRTAPSERSQPASYEKYLIQGTQFQQQGRYVEALAAYTAALNEVERWLGPDDITAAQILVSIGSLRILRHDDLGANEALERSIRITERALGPDDLQVGFALQTMAMLSHKHGHYSKAEQFYRRALLILEKNLGPMHERTAFLETAMARMFIVQRRNSEAKALLEKAIPALEKAGEPDLPALAFALTHLAEAYQLDGRYSKADPHYARVLILVQKDPRAINDDVRMGLRAYAQMLRQIKRKTEARKLELQIKTMLPNRSSAR